MTAPATPPTQPSPPKTNVPKVLCGLAIAAFGIWLIVTERHAMTTAILIGGLAVYGLGMFMLVPKEVSGFFSLASSAVSSIFRAKHGGNDP